MRRPSVRGLARVVLLVGVAVALSVPAIGAGPVRAPPALPIVERGTTTAAVVGQLRGLAPVRPGVLGASARMIVTTNDTAAVPDDGLATNLTAFPSVSFPKNSSFQTGAEQVIGQFDAVFGIFTNDKTPPTAFFEVFDNSTDASLRLEYWTGLPIVGGQPYDFQLLAGASGTWALSVNGVPFGNNTTTADFDFGVGEATWEAGIGFSEVAIYSATTTVPSSYLATTALAVHRPGVGWYLPLEGAAHYLGPPGDAWGADGRLEVPDLPPGAVVSGTSYGAVDTNSTLWRGGPVPVNVSVVASESSATGLSAVPVTVNVTSTSGESLGGVPVYVGDSLDGSASPATVVTSSTGSSSTLLLSPNVSAAATDTIRATVTVLGYVGVASTSIDLVPAQEVVVTATPSSLVLTPGQNVSVTFQTETAAHQSVSGITLTFQAFSLPPVAGVPLSVVTYPDAGVTNGSGLLGIFVQAPTGGGTFAVFADVASLGDWGHTNLSVTVRSLAPSVWQRYGSDVELGGGLGALGVVAAVLLLLVRRRRRGRSSLPEMDLRTLRQQSRDTDGAGASSAINRTPPASGSP